MLCLFQNKGIRAGILEKKKDQIGLILGKSIRLEFCRNFSGVLVVIRILKFCEEVRKKG